MQKKLKLLLVNIAILFVGIILIELFFGGWFNESNELNNLGIIRDAKFEFDVRHLYDTKNPIITYSRDSYGLRGISTFNQPEKITILTVGGSTTDQRYIDDVQTWQTVLEKEFQRKNQNIFVSNAGVDGQSTFGHVKSTEIWFPKIEKLRPKVILFYVGINDFYRVSDDSKFDEIAIIESKSVKSQIKDKSAIYNAYRKIRGMQKAQKFEVGHRRIDFSRVQYTKEEILNEKLLEIYDEKNLKAFKSRIQQLVTYTKRINAIPVFVTQPSLHYKLRNDKLFGTELIQYLEDKYAYNGIGYYRLLNKLNEAITEVAGPKLVIDLTNDNDWHVTDFYDYFHNTPTGAKKLGKKIYQKINERALLK